jgi:hypothetical protein
LLIQSVAVIAQPIASSAGTAVVLRHITAGRTCTVIVMHAIEKWLRSLINGVEHGVEGIKTFSLHVVGWRLSVRALATDIGIAAAGQSVIRGVGGQDREPERVQVFRIDHAAVVVAFDEQDGLRSWQGTWLSGTAVKRPSNPRQVR